MPRPRAAYGGARLAPDALSFGKQAAGPVDQAFELAKSAMAALTRKE
jgi:hypothetical protein